VIECLRVFGHAGFFARGYPSSKYYLPEPSMTQLPSKDYRQSFSSDPGSATITVLVPNQDAQVWLGDAPTKERGMERRFHAHGLLQPGTYVIGARWTDNGRTVNQQCFVQVQPGQAVVVDFRTPAGESLRAPRQREYSESRYVKSIASQISV